MESIVLTINGQKVSCPSGASILTAAEKNGIKIPTLCYHPDLKPHGACRLCLVEDEKTGRVMASCVTPAAQDMSILTDTPKIIKHRKNIVRLMMAEHPESCIVCSKGNRCELRKIAASLGVGESGLYPMPNYIPYEQLNPFIIRDLSKCILCGKCIRADHELVVTGAIDYNHRGFHSRPATLYEKPLEDSICTFCGTCVSICPTGALSVKNMTYVGTPEKETDAICGFCGAGCSLTMGVAGEKIVEVNPSKSRISVNGATLCIRGHFANDFINSKDRLMQPMLRSSEEDDENLYVPVSWDKALETVATRLSEIKREHGPQSLAFIGSSKCTNEENYLFQKIARNIFKTRNVVNGGYATGQKLISLIDAKTHGSCRTAALSDLEQAPVIVVVNTDPEQTVPVAGYHIKRAAKNGSTLIVIDSLKTDLVRLASLWLRPAPSLDAQSKTTTADLINGISKKIISEKSYDHNFIDTYTQGFDQFNESVLNLDLNKNTGQTVAPADLLNQTIDLIKGKKIAFVIGADILHYPDGNRIIDAIMNLAFLTGSIGAKRPGIYILVGENNSIGAMDMGMVPDLLPGRVNITAEDEAGTDLSAFIESAETGKIKGAYIMGENLLRSLPEPKRVAAALDKLEFVVVQDILNNRTVQKADVVLPGAVAAEKYGSFTNMEGRIQTFEPVVPPPGEAMPDWEILALFAKKMGHPEQYETVEKIRQEIRRAVPMYQGLGNHRQGWIKSNEQNSPVAGNSIKFSFSPALPKAGRAAEDAYPFMARISPLRCHLGCGTRTSRSKRIQSYDEKGEIEISKADCQSLGLGSTGQVTVSSKLGTVERAFKENNRLPAGQVVIPMAFNNNDAMNLVSLTETEQPGSYGWSFCTVNIEKVVKS